MEIKKKAKKKKFKKGKVNLSKWEPVSGRPRWNKKGKRRKRDQQGESRMKRAKWHLEEKRQGTKGRGVNKKDNFPNVRSI